MAEVHDLTVETLVQRALKQGDLALLQLWFDAAVLEKYRGSANYQLIRTDTIGRLSRPRVWTLDFGIGEGEKVIHLSVQDLVQKLPEGERAHWAQHAVTPPVSEVFLRTRLAPASCIDDGDVRSW